MSSRKLRLEGKFLNVIKGIYEKSIANILNSERLSVFFLRSRTRQRCLLSSLLFFFIFMILFILFMRNTERGRDTGRGRSRLHAGSPTWDLIPGLQDHALG